MDNISDKISEEGLVIPIFKPINWTSFDVVKYVRGVIKRNTQLKKIKVGHAGTLDPLASGLLIICLLYTSPSPRDRTRSRMPSSA